MEDLEMNSNTTFFTTDYIVFAIMLIGSASVGVYYAFSSSQKKEKISKTDEQEPLPTAAVTASDETIEYLIGNKKMSPFPVALSLISSYISAVTILGTPAEIYNYGTQYWLLFISIWIMGIVVAFVYVPVFFKLNVKSSYEYLEFRFHRYVRIIVSVLYIIDEILFLPMVVYVPSLAFEQVTGLNLHFVSWLSTSICVFYTFMGGLKAVIWTDTWQILVMTLSTVTIAFIGTSAVGGFTTMWIRAHEGGRLIFFNTDSSLTERQTLWSVLIGGFTFWTSYNAVHQTMVQRYVSLPTLKKAKITVIMFSIGVSIFVTICSYTGLIIYAAYWKCDPILSKLCKTDDQILPAFVTQFLNYIPGISGLFIAGIFGAGLSSLSVILNSTSIVILEDIIKSLCQCQLSDRATRICAKIFILLLGLHTVLGVYVVKNLGGVLSVATSFNAIASGTTFGLFSLGMLIPFANTKGAIAGGIAAATVSGCISIGTQYFHAAGLVKSHTKLPVSIEGCTFNNITTAIFTSTTLKPSAFTSESDVPIIFRLSYLWVAPIGFITTMLVGIVVSLLTRNRNGFYVNPDYYSPVIYPFLSKSIRNLSTNQHVSSSPAST